MLTNRGFIDRLAFSDKIFIAPWIDGLAQQILFSFVSYHQSERLTFLFFTLI